MLIVVVPTLHCRVFQIAVRTGGGGWGAGRWDNRIFYWGNFFTG